MAMEHYPHQEPTPALIDTNRGAYIHASLVPTRVRSFSFGLFFGYSLAIIHMGTLIAILIEIRK